MAELEPLPITIDTNEALLKLAEMNHEVDALLDKLVRCKDTTAAFGSAFRRIGAELPASKRLSALTVAGLAASAVGTALLAGVFGYRFGRRPPSKVEPVTITHEVTMTARGADLISVLNTAKARQDRIVGKPDPAQPHL